MRKSLVLLLVALAACRPPASDDYVQRIELGGSAGPTVMASSPVVDDAVWASGGKPERIVFGVPGKAPYFALECSGQEKRRALEITRFAPTDPKAKGMIALVGNGHVERLKIDSRWNGRAWIWHGRYDPHDTRLDALAGARRLEVTIPGAGTLALEGSTRPGELIELCRRLSAPDVSASPDPLPPA